MQQSGSSHASVPNASMPNPTHPATQPAKPLSFGDQRWQQHKQQRKVVFDQREIRMRQGAPRKGASLGAAHRNESDGTGYDEAEQFDSFDGATEREEQAPQIGKIEEQCEETEERVNGTVIPELN